MATHKHMVTTAVFGSCSALVGILVGWIRPDQLWECGSGSGRARHPKKIEKVKKFHILKCWMFSFEG